MLVRLHGLLLAPPVVAWLIWRWYRHEREQQCWGGSCTATPGATVQLSPQRRPHLWLPLAKGMAAWLAGGAAVFFVGWPWLWLAPLARFRQYLASGTARQTIHVFYMGQVWNDRDVPWHYPWVMFAVTVPVGLLLLGALGMWAQRCECKMQNAKCKLSASNPQSLIPNPSPANPLPKGEGTLLAGVMLFVLTVFSLPGTHVYDGVRLFLMVFPLWAVWVGIGAKWLVFWGSSIVAVIKFQKNHLANSRELTAPGESCEICESIGDVPGAVSSPAIYAWVSLHGSGSAIHRVAGAGPAALQPVPSELLQPVGRRTGRGGKAGVRGDILGRHGPRADAGRGRSIVAGGATAVCTELRTVQARTVEASSPALHDAHVVLVGWDELKPEEAQSCRYAVIYHRRADLAGAMRFLEGGKVVQEYSQQGVWMARLVQFGPPPRSVPGG